MEIVLKGLPTLATVLAVALVLWVGRRLLHRAGERAQGQQFRNQLIMLGLSAAGVLAVLMVLPIGDTLRGQLLSLAGIVLSAAIALSSTTLLGNAVAGIMLKAVRHFRTGDFIECGPHFGRVSERGLIHTEIQNEDRCLVTLPNLYLASHPVTVVRSSGTVVSCRVSLGYDVPRARVEELLLAAAAACELSDPFVHVLELGDFSVTYKVAGLLDEVKQLLSARSRLRGRVMDALHQGGVEIVSPSFMNTRGIAEGRLFVPPVAAAAAPEPAAAPDEPLPEDVVFDKAEEAESEEARRTRLREIEERIKALQKELEATDESARARLTYDIAALERQRDALATALEAAAAVREEPPGMDG